MASRNALAPGVQNQRAPDGMRDVCGTSQSILASGGRARTRRLLPGRGWTLEHGRPVAAPPRQVQSARSTAAAPLRRRLRAPKPMGASCAVSSTAGLTNVEHLRGIDSAGVSRLTGRYCHRPRQTLTAATAGASSPCRAGRGPVLCSDSLQWQPPLQLWPAPKARRARRHTTPRARSGARGALASSKAKAIL